MSAAMRSLSLQAGSGCAAFDSLLFETFESTKLCTSQKELCLNNKLQLASLSAWRIRTRRRQKRPHLKRACLKKIFSFLQAV